jgi:hypothetical protein
LALLIIHPTDVGAQDASDELEQGVIVRVALLPGRVFPESKLPETLTSSSGCIQGAVLKY